MEDKIYLFVFIAIIILNSGFAYGEESPKTGTAILAVSDFNSPGTTINVKHAAVLFENPEDHTYNFVSIGAKFPYQGMPLELDDDEKQGLTREEAEKELERGGYTKFKTLQVENPKFNDANKKVNDLKNKNYNIAASLTPWGENCLTSGVQILNEYGAKMPEIQFLHPTPNYYYERLSGDEHIWDDKGNKYVSKKTGAPPESSSEESDLGGVNFTSIKLNYISVSTDQDGDINFDLILKAQKADSSIPGIDLMNTSSLGTTAFITGLVVPESKFWVNLNPWEQDRIIDQQLNQSEVGRIMLEADLQMKRDSNNYENPCANETGKALWNLADKKHETLVQQCMNKFPGEIKDINNIRLRAVTRLWIVPDKIYAYTNGTEIYIINATLTIRSEPKSDRSSFLVDNQDIGTLSKDCLEELNKSAKEFGKYVRELTDSMLLPYVIADINNGKEFEALRDIYVALALAQWYKSKVTSKKDIFREVRDSSNFNVLKSMKTWSSHEIWEEYVSSFENGDYNCWANETIETASGDLTNSRLYSSGGVEFYVIKDHLIEIEEIPLSVKDQVYKAINDGFINQEKDVYFGIRLHVDKKKEVQVADSSSGSLSESMKSKQGTQSNSDESEIYSDDPNVMDKGNSSDSPCPEGWTGPDEKGDCWKMEITS